MRPEKDDWRSEEDFMDEEAYFAARDAAPGDRAKSAQLWIGTSGWSYKDWLGSFYEAGTRPENFLRSYASSFRTVEVDSTFYAVPRSSVIRAWAERSPADFVFAAKFPRGITHEAGGLENGAGLTRLFLRRMALLGDKLGPLLLQFPPFFRIERLDALQTYLASLPREFRYAVELRHPEWHAEPVLELLARRNMAWASGVGPDSPPVRPLTADFAYLRWLGDRQIQSFGEIRLDRRAELQEWARWIEQQRERLREIYGYFNNHYAGHGPASARSLLAMLRQPAPPPPAERQGDLFG
jgi:uncharacterized protein YecE (DUF72 family)